MGFLDQPTSTEKPTSECGYTEEKRENQPSSVHRIPLTMEDVRKQPQVRDALRVTNPMKSHL